LNEVELSCMCLGARDGWVGSVAQRWIEMSLMDGLIDVTFPACLSVPVELHSNSNSNLETLLAHLPNIPSLL